MRARKWWATGLASVVGGMGLVGPGPAAADVDYCAGHGTMEWSPSTGHLTAQLGFGHCASGSGVVFNLSLHGTCLLAAGQGTVGGRQSHDFTATWVAGEMTWQGEAFAHWTATPDPTSAAPCVDGARWLISGSLVLADAR